MARHFCPLPSDILLSNVSEISWRFVCMYVQYVLFNVRDAIRYSDIGRAELGRPGSNYLFAYHGASATQLKRTIVGACFPIGYDMQQSWVWGKRKCSQGA